MINKRLKSKLNCKRFRSEDVVNYCITAMVYNAGRKAEVLDKVGVWAAGINLQKKYQ